MIIADLNACHRYYNLHPRMKEMMEYILQHDFSQQEAGRITLDSDDLFINLDEVELKTKEEQRFQLIQTEDLKQFQIQLEQLESILHILHKVKIIDKNS